MREETLHAANWWVERIMSYNITVEAPSWQSHFEKVMTELLRAKYHNHWYIDDPSRGHGYRAISNEYSLDPILNKAAMAVSHSLPKNLARMVLTSEDRWLVMFVNPGCVILRDKRYCDQSIYSLKHHIYKKNLRNKILNKSSSKLLKKRSKSHNFNYSKSDDDGKDKNGKKKNKNKNKNKLSKNNKNNKDKDGDDVESKSNPSLSGTGATDDQQSVSDPDNPNANTNANTNANANPNTQTKDDIVDYRELFLQHIHNRARLNKEKEIENHVRAYKKEMREKHKKSIKFGSYDDEDKLYKSPSKSSSISNTLSASQSPSISKSNSKSRSRSHSHSKSPKKSTKKQDATKTKTKTKTKSKTKTIAITPSASASASANANTKTKTNANDKNTTTGTNAQTQSQSQSLLNVLNTMNIKLPQQHSNGLYNNHSSSNSNGFCMTNTSRNYGKHLASILSKERNKNKDKNKNPTNGYNIKIKDEYPILFPISYPSPSPSPSASLIDIASSITPYNSDYDDDNIHLISNDDNFKLDDNTQTRTATTTQSQSQLSNTSIQALNPSKSNPNPIKPNYFYPSQSFKKMKSTGTILKNGHRGFELHITASSDDDDDDIMQSQMKIKPLNKNNNNNNPSDQLEDDNDSEIVTHNTSTPIYGNSKLNQPNTSSTSNE